MMALPFSPPAKAPALVSRRRPDIRILGPWQLMQDFSKIGKTSVAKSTLCGSGFWNAATRRLGTKINRGAPARAAAAKRIRQVSFIAQQGAEARTSRARRACLDSIAVWVRKGGGRSERGTLPAGHPS